MIRIGIVAQSTSVAAVAMVAWLSPGTISGGTSSKMNLSLSIGGQGGIGGDGNAVDVFTTGDIMTLGDDSHGILAQSVGGGGGSSSGLAARHGS